MGAFNSHFKLQAYIHILAASSARALLVSLPSFQKEGAGKTGCRLAPMAPVLNIAQAMHRGKPQAKPEATRPSLRSGLTAYGVLLCLQDLPECANGRF